MPTLQIASYAAHILQEGYWRYLNTWDELHPDYEFLSFSDWAIVQSETDPCFYRWIFDNKDIRDFGENLRDKDKKAVLDFLDTLQAETRFE